MLFILACVHFDGEQHGFMDSGSSEGKILDDRFDQILYLPFVSLRGCVILTL